jgi:hypothetical protein
MKIDAVFLLIVISTCVISNGVAQKMYPAKNSFIKNDSIKYSFAYVSMKMNFTKKTFIPSKHIIEIKLDTLEEDIVQKIKKDEWLTLLSDTTTDWAANLLLYYLHRRDAVQYYVNIKNREYWVLLNQKRKEIRYWQKYLSSHLRQ